MTFANLDDLLHMGGHGFYVWLSYGVAVTALLWLVIAPLLRRRDLLAGIAREARRETPASRSETDSAE